MVSRLIKFVFSLFGYWCLKFVELLGSQKLSFSIFSVLKGLNVKLYHMFV